MKSLDQPVEYVRENRKGLWSDGIDAAVIFKRDNSSLTPPQAYFFKGGEYIRYNILTDQVEPGYPKAISQSWRGLWSAGIDAAVSWGNGKIYFFRGDEYIRFDLSRDRADPGYPRKISETWGGLWPSGVDAAVNWGNGKVYFLKGNEYIRWDISSDHIDSGFPKPLYGNGWFLKHR
jgi:hemopexin